MTHDLPQTLASLPPELLAGVREVLREGESLADFLETALRQQLAQRQAAAAQPPLQAPRGEPRAAPGARHAADVLLAQLDTWLKVLPPGGADFSAGGGSPAR